MIRRAAACLGVLLVASATAAAQTPPDERTAARAFADAALRFRAGLPSLEPRYDELSRTPVPRCVTRLMRRVPGRVEQVRLLPLANFYGEIGRLFGPALTQLSTELHGVQTADPALRSGRTAWRRTRRVFSEFAALPPIDLCTEARRFVAAGYELTPAMRRSRRLLALFERDPLHDFDQRVERAERRLRELGIPREQAAAFAADVDDTFEDAR